MANEQDNYKINFDTNAKKAAQDTNELAKGLDNVDDSTQKVVNSNKSLKAQMKEATIELIQAQQKFGDYSKEALNAAKNLAELKDKIAEASETANLFDPGKKFQAVAGAVSAVASGFAVAQGAMGLFGAESEEVEKTLLKVQSAMALSQGLSTIADSAKDFQRLKAVVVDAMKSIATAKAVDTVATETSIAVENQSTASKIKSIAVTGIKTAATSVATAAQWLWNTAVMANPIVALIVAVAAAAAGIYAFTKMLMDSSEANDKAAEKTKSLEKELDKESITLAKTGKAVRDKNEHTLAMAKANGQSSDSIRKLEAKLIDEQIATDKASVMTARNTFIQERNNLAKLKASDASDEIIKAREKEVQAAYDTFQRENKQLDASYKERAELKKTHLVEIAKEEKDAENKASDERKKANEKRLADEKEAANKRLEEQKKQKEKEAALIKEGLDYENNLRKQLEDLGDDTEEEKLNRMRSRAEIEIEALKQKGINVEEITRLNAEKFDELEAELAEKRNEEDLDRQAKKGLEEIEIASSNADRQIEIEQRVADGKKNIQEASYSILEKGISVLQTFAGKNKAIQKGLIIAESAIGVSKIVTSTQAANAADTAAAALMGPAGVGYLATKKTINTISAGLGIAANLAATSKALSALGGGGGSAGGSNMGGGGGAVSATPPTVAFNNTAENQIGQSVARTQAEQPPLQVTVLESDISKAQNNVAKLNETNTL